MRLNSERLPILSFVSLCLEMGGTIVEDGIEIAYLHITRIIRNRFSERAAVEFKQPYTLQNPFPGLILKISEFLDLKQAFQLEKSNHHFKNELSAALKKRYIEETPGALELLRKLPQRPSEWEQIYNASNDKKTDIDIKRLTPGQVSTLIGYCKPLKKINADLKSLVQLRSIRGTATTLLTGIGRNRRIHGAMAIAYNLCVLSSSFERRINFEELRKIGLEAVPALFIGIAYGIVFFHSQLNWLRVSVPTHLQDLDHLFELVTEPLRLYHQIRLQLTLKEHKSQFGNSASFLAKLPKKPRDESTPNAAPTP